MIAEAVISYLITTLKAILFGIVEGITEWLPISSTGHMILLERILPLDFSEEFKTLFLVVIQLGAVLAVLTVYPERFGLKTQKTADVKRESHENTALWKKVLIAMLPACVCGFLLEDFSDRLFTPVTVAAMLIVYGILFLLLERKEKGKNPTVTDLSAIGKKDALKVGAWQVLSLIPGTSRSGSTILGGLLSGMSRKTACEFSFFLAVPIMVGASGLKLAKFFLAGCEVPAADWGFLILGALTAYLVSLLSVRFLVSFVSHHTFRSFGIYRILLGIAVLLFL